MPFGQPRQGGKATVGNRCYSPDEDAANHLHMPLWLPFLFVAAQTQHLRSLAASELLQQDFATVGKADPITICERFQGPLNKRHFLDCTHPSAAANSV
jgi:hypothetical protein